MLEYAMTLGLMVQGAQVRAYCSSGLRVQVSLAEATQVHISTIL